MANEQHLSDVDLLTVDFHVWPDLHGNRSPLADSTIKGMICGLTLSTTVENLAITYLGFVQSLSVRHDFFFLLSIIRFYNGIQIYRGLFFFTQLLVWNETYFRSIIG